MKKLQHYTQLTEQPSNGIDEDTAITSGLPGPIAPLGAFFFGNKIIYLNEFNDDVDGPSETSWNEYMEREVWSL